MQMNRRCYGRSHQDINHQPYCWYSDATARSISCSFAFRPVSGLASLDLPPSHKILPPVCFLGGIAHSGILADPHSLTVAGAAQVSGLNSLTCFPFNPSACRREPQSGAHFTTNNMFPLNQANHQGYKTHAQRRLTI